MRGRFIAVFEVQRGDEVLRGVLIVERAPVERPTAPPTLRPPVRAIPQVLEAELVDTRAA